MASISVTAPMPPHTPSSLDTPLFLPNSGSPHRRRQTRNPNLPPLPVFSFNPGNATGSEDQGRAPSPTHPILEEMAARQEPKKALKPAPLPPFTFNPGAQMDIQRSPSPTHPILEEMAQHQSRRAPRPSPLPDFTRGATSTEQLTSSPTRSSFESSAGRSAGHRRQGSELIGGVSDGGHLTSPSMISSSPTKADESRSLVVPPVPNSGAGRYTHRHRRSEAVSISGIDASELIKASAVSKHRAGSAPSTPSDATGHFPRLESSPKPSQSISAPPPSSIAASRHRRESAPGVRPRVGFSDKVDVIPRPLSLISSETEGSSSTMRGTHSLTGSVNSFSGTSPPPHSITSHPRNSDDDGPRKRPSTADAASPSPASREKLKPPTEIQLSKRPVSASAMAGFHPSSGSPQTKRKHFWFHSSNEGSPMAAPGSERTEPISDLTEFAPSSGPAKVRPKTSPERAASIKKRKVRSWTGHLFHRKAKQHTPKSKATRTPTPPSLTRQMSDNINEIFDADNTIVIRNSPSPESKKAATKPEASLNTSTSLHDHQADDCITSPILDLDAALGPFGSEEKLAGSDHASKTATSRILRLHSSERRVVMDTFGSFHRRAESAPQMPPVNQALLSVHRMGSTASIADDVFDEEEEDDFLANERHPDENTAEGMNDVGKTETADSLTTNGAASEHVTTGVQDAMQDPPDERGLGLGIAPDTVDAVAIVDVDSPFEPQPARASNSTITAPAIEETDIPKRPSSSPMEFLYGAPQTSYASSTEGRTTASSAISSPDAEHISFDHHTRINRYFGEATLNGVVRGSNDDLPSLTDSVSTGVMPRFSSSAGTRSSSEQRAMSFSAPSHVKSTQTWKRASLASLNRLIPGSTNGSKLRFEESAPPAEEETKKKKGYRISRLVNFWRSKEKASK